MARAAAQRIRNRPLPLSVTAEEASRRSEAAGDRVVTPDEKSQGADEADDEFGQCSGGRAADRGAVGGVPPGRVVSGKRDVLADEIVHGDVEIPADDQELFALGDGRARLT